jgi:hypothetical protein
MFGFFGKKAKYESFNWWENFMSGHISIYNITIFGANAMNWAVNIRTKKWGYICFTLPSIRRYKSNQGHYFYLSPNATPWACTYYIGCDKKEEIRAKIRKLNFGHNFNTTCKRDELRCLNNKFDYFIITEYDINK